MAAPNTSLAGWLDRQEPKMSFSIPWDLALLLLFMPKKEKKEKEGGREGRKGAQSDD